MLSCFAVSAAHHRAWGSEWRLGLKEEVEHQEGLVCEARIPARASGSGSWQVWRRHPWARGPGRLWQHAQCGRRLYTRASAAAAATLAVAVLPCAAVTSSSYLGDPGPGHCFPAAGRVPPGRSPSWARGGQRGQLSGVRKSDEGRFPKHPLPARWRPTSPHPKPARAGAALPAHPARRVSSPSTLRFWRRGPPPAERHGSGSKNLGARIWLPFRLKKQKGKKFLDRRGCGRGTQFGDGRPLLAGVQEQSCSRPFPSRRAQPNSPVLSW